MVVHFVVVGLIPVLVVLGFVLGKSRSNTLVKETAASRVVVEALGLVVVGTLVGAILGGTVGATWVIGWIALCVWFACWTLSGTWAPGTNQLPWLRLVGVAVGGLTYVLFVASPWVWPILLELLKQTRE